MQSQGQVVLLSVSLLNTKGSKTHVTCNKLHWSRLGMFDMKHPECIVGILRAQELQVAYP